MNFSCALNNVRLCRGLCMCDGVFTTSGRIPAGNPESPGIARSFMECARMQVFSR